jgi:hypothetical protein
MSRLLVVVAREDGAVDAVLADSLDVVAGERCFRSGSEVVLRLPLDRPAVVRVVAPRPVPALEWAGLRAALRSNS